MKTKIFNDFFYAYLLRGTGMQNVSFLIIFRIRIERFRELFAARRVAPLTVKRRALRIRLDCTQWTPNKNWNKTRRRLDVVVCPPAVNTGCPITGFRLHDALLALQRAESRALYSILRALPLSLSISSVLSRSLPLCLLHEKRKPLANQRVATTRACNLAQSIRIFSLFWFYYPNKQLSKELLRLRLRFCRVFNFSIWIIPF